MAEKTKMISVNAFEKAAAVEPAVETFEWNGLQIEIKKRIGLQDVIDFAKSVASACFADDTGEYMPEVRDFAIKTYIIEKYTNIRLPSNTKTMYDLLYSCDIVPFVMDKIDTAQLEEIVDAIDDRIGMTARANVENLNKQVGELQKVVEDIAENMGALFDGIDGDTMNALVGAMANGKFDEGKLVTEYFNRYKSGEDEQVDEVKEEGA